jgi:hypothetical protein
MAACAGLQKAPKTQRCLPAFTGFCVELPVPAFKKVCFFACRTNNKRI